MTSEAQKRERAAKVFLAFGRRGRSGSRSWLRASTVGVLIGLALLSTVRAGTQPPAKFAKLTPEQARTLLALAHDYHPRDGVAESNYATCIAPYGAQAGNAQDKQSIDDAMALVEGAARRMGYPSYPAITDDYERMRLATVLAENGWMKQFRMDVGQCLDRASRPR